MVESNEERAWALLNAAKVYYRGRPVGTVAARDEGTTQVNYDQVFTRDVAVSAFAELLVGRYEMTRHVLEELARLQQHARQFDCFQPGQGVMPASFKVSADAQDGGLIADFGERAIGRVPPVDSGFWWLLILHAYVAASGDRAFAEREPMQAAIRRILDLSLTIHFDMFPTMLVPDGSFMIDRRMGVYGYPLDIQALFFAALRAAETLLSPDPANAIYRAAASTRQEHLVYHVRKYYWLDLEHLERMHRAPVEEYGEDASNQFNVYPDTIPDWLVDWLPDTGGYFAGNVGPGRMDYRYFAFGNLLSIVSGLANGEQRAALLSLNSKRAQDLLGQVPLKLIFPALEGTSWSLVTGMDPKNRPWSYHNGGSWPSLIWLLAAACTICGTSERLDPALDALDARLGSDGWPEYYDGRRGQLLGRQARRYQTWTVAGYLIARHLRRHPEDIARLGFDGIAQGSACTV